MTNCVPLQSRHYCRLDDIPNVIKLEDLEPIYMKCSMSEKLAILRTLTTEQYNYFFQKLPVEEQVKMAEYVANKQKEQEEKSFNDCQELMELVSEGDLTCMLVSILIEPLGEKLFKKVDNQNLLTDNAYKFKLPRYFKDIKKQYARLQPFCLKQEGGCISQLMTSALPHWWKEYEGIGNFYHLMKKDYPGVMKKHIDKLYVEIRKMFSRSIDKYGDIITTSLLINLICQIAINKVKEVNNKMKEIRNEDEQISRIKEARKKGSNVKLHNYYHLNDEIFRNVAFDCEQIGLIISKDYGTIFKSKKMRQIYLDMDVKLNDINLYYPLMEKCVLYCIKEYLQFYFAKMILVARNNEGMPEGVKGDIKFLFQSDFGYCRLMKDIRGIAPMTYESDPLDVADEVKEILANNERKFPTLRLAMQRVIAMRSKDFEYDKKFLKKIHDDNIRKLKAQNKKAV